MEKCNGYIIRETPPQVVLRLSMELDPSEPEMLQGYFLPNLAFTGQLKLKVRRERACAYMYATTCERAANKTSRLRCPDHI